MLSGFYHAIMGADESSLQPNDKEKKNEGGGKMNPKIKAEFQESIRTMYAQRYLTASQQIFARDASNGLKIKPGQRVRNKLGENCFETEVHVLLLVRKPADSTFLVIMQKDTKELNIPQTIVGKGENIAIAAERLAEQSIQGAEFTFSGMLRFELTPTHANTRMVVILEAIAQDDMPEETNMSPIPVDPMATFEYKWYTKKQIGNGRKRSSMMRRTKSLNNSNNPMNNVHNGNIGAILKWADAGSYPFPIDLLRESGLANSPGRVALSATKPAEHGNKYAFQIVLCCMLEAEGTRKLLVDASEGLPKKYMKISTSFEDVANDMLIDLGAMCNCQVDPLGILQVAIHHSNVGDSGDHGAITVTYLALFPESALHAKMKDGFHWSSLQEAVKARLPEIDLFTQAVRCKDLCPCTFLTSERARYVKLTPVELDQEIEALAVT